MVKLPRLVQDFLENSAAQLPDKIALVHEGRRLTYAQLDVMANRVAHALLAQGCKRGDRVAIYLNNSVEAVVGIFATLKAGGIFVMINRTTKADKLLYILNNCRAACLLSDARLDQHNLTGRVLEEAPNLKGIFFCGENAAIAACRDRARCRDFDAIQLSQPSTCPQRVCIDFDLACLIYTSGTTGEPKGVMSDHSNVIFATGSIIEYLQNVETDVVLNVLPLSFDYGLYQLLMTFRFGGTLVLENSFAYPAVILNRIAEEKVTGFPGVPTVFAMLVRMDLSAFDLSSLRYLTNTAAALPVSHINELREKFPGVTLYSMYGLTETKRTLYLPPALLEKKPGSVGIPIPGTEVWIEDDSGNRLGPGVTGELVVRGRHVMRGYWESPEATARRFRPGPLGWNRVCYSGDLFRMDEDGYMYFIGRKDDIIKSRGEKVAPKEVETVIYAMKGVVEVAVLGIPDALLGQAVKAFIVTDNPELTVNKILAHCRANLEDFMVPKHIEFRDALPKSTSGKVNRNELVASAESQFTIHRS
jgi:amino acid adenylation domain-containing protein